MSDSFYSSSWYRVAELKPRLRGHALLHRHVYRGHIWYVLQDSASGKSHRFSPAAYRFIGLMDGKRTVNELWDIVCAEAGDESPTQDEVIRLLGQLHAVDALICDIVPDSEEIFRRYRKHDSMKLKQRLWSPLAVRFPLIDPEKFLTRTYPYLAPLFTRLGALVWLVTIIVAMILAGIHWDGLTKDVADRALTPSNLIIMWMVYPIVKAIHELGHGYAVKHAGGEVHEIGVMLLVLIPVPYVDASSAWGIRDKGQRMLIGAAGILVELFLGALALFVWINVEPGLVHAIAYNTMLICGVSTLLFNGNPLLKFDGYYVFSDAVEIPNLGTRSTQYLGYLIQHYVLRMPGVHSPATSTGERFWFFVYGIASFCYRLFIMFVIILYIGGKFFAVGVLLAMWSVTTQIIAPVSRGVMFLFNDPRVRRQRGRSLGVTVGIFAGLMLMVLAMPLPFWTVADGVVWPSERSYLRAGSDGFVTEILVDGGSRVEVDQPIIQMRDPFLEARLEILEANLRELNSQLTFARATDRVQVSLIREELAAVTADLGRARERVNELLVLSRRSGTLVIPEEKDFIGRFARKGERLAYVIEPEDLLTVRAVVTNEEVALISDQTEGVLVRSVSWDSPTWQAQIVRQVPGGTTQLPTPSLGTEGGGLILVDPRASDGVTTLARVFEVDVGLPLEAQPEFLGQRMKVRFDHGTMPLAQQVYRELRQLFMSQFGV
ncbi:MAG: hypothetical protein ABJ084_16175 [Halioglobus sp.]